MMPLFPRTLQLLNRRYAIVMLLSASVAFIAWQSAVSSETSPDEAGGGLADHRLREGTKITKIDGTFRIMGDRASFHPAETEKSYVGLENLNLARIIDVLQEAAVVEGTTDHIEWSVSGMMTEFRGTNYLLVSRAVTKARVEEPHAALSHSTQASPARP